jgi:pyruvate kinase
MMSLPVNKTKIVCTIGPASDSPQVLEEMIWAGMNIVRLNFSHGDFDSHKKVIDEVRAVSKAMGRRVAIMGDLPGPKMRIGNLREEPVELKRGDLFCLTTEDILGDQNKVSVSFSRLPQVVKPGDVLFINDGIINIKVESVEGTTVRCRVEVGGELRSRKGLNLPGIDLGINAFTDHDHACLQFASEQGLDAVSQSFVETAADVSAVRQSADAMGYHPFIIAKIERSGARDHIDAILDVADGIMVARGDLGVEIPIEEIAIAQKLLIEKARIAGKPVIVATQMLESMTESKRPTRAETTDVANAILDGTDCVMLSGESAMGKYPVEAVGMLAKIAAATEPHRKQYRLKERLEASDHKGNPYIVDLIALSVYHALQRLSAAVVFVPTAHGATARNITRFMLPEWIMAVSSHEATCQNLLFSYGVFPIHESKHPEDWRRYSKKWLQSQDLDRRYVVVTEGPSKRNPQSNNRMEIIDLDPL